MTDHQGKGSTGGEMPIMSSEEMHLHDAVAFWEAIQAALANAGLLKAYSLRLTSLLRERNDSGREVSLLCTGKAV